MKGVAEKINVAKHIFPIDVDVKKNGTMGQFKKIHII